jgi:hypothetical protein
MKLNEAIRLGAMLKPQSYKDLLDPGGRTCALGAAVDALGLYRNNADFAFELHDLFTRYPFIHKASRCPACLPVVGFVRRRLNWEYDVEDVIAHLNDDHEWTRERIADWVATIEPACDSSDAAQGQAVATAVALCAPK